MNGVDMTMTFRLYLLSNLWREGGRDASKRFSILSTAVALLGFYSISIRLSFKGSNLGNEKVYEAISGSN